MNVWIHASYVQFYHKSWSNCIYSRYKANYTFRCRDISCMYLQMLYELYDWIRKSLKIINAFYIKTNKKQMPLEKTICESYKLWKTGHIVQVKDTFIFI